MSDAGLAATAPEVEEVKPETQTSETTPETPSEVVPETPEAPQAAEVEQEQPKPQKMGKGVQARIDELTRQREEARRELARANAERDLYRSMAQGENRAPEQGDGAVPKPNQPDIRAMIEAEAAKMVAQREQQAKTANFFKNGRVAFSDFDQRCQTIDGLGATDRPDFVQFVTEVPEGPKIVAALADDPDEASRILALPGPLMSIELSKKAVAMANAPQRSTISRAPAPAKPLDGGAKASDELSDDDSDAAWFKKREKQLAAQRAGKAAAR